MDDIDALFGRLETIAPARDFSDRVLAAAREAQRKRRVRVASALYVALSATVAGLVWSAWFAVQELANSPVPGLLYILVSDTRTVLENFSSWALAVIESTALEPLILMAVALFVLSRILGKLFAMLRFHSNGHPNGTSRA